MRRCVWSRNLENEEAMDRVGLQLARKKNSWKLEIMMLKQQNKNQRVKNFFSELFY